MSMTALGPEEIARRLYHSERVHVPLGSPDQFCDDHIAQYRRDGFLAIENVFTPGEVEAAKAGLSHLIGGKVPTFKGVHFEEGVDVTGMDADRRENCVRKLHSFVEYDARLKRLSSHPKLIQVVEQLVGTPVTMIQDMALLKPPHVGREKPWHQDNAYFHLGPMDLIVGTWTALDEATPENGCMHVIPGSHLPGPQPHHRDRDLQLPDEDVAVGQDVMVPLKPGGVLFFSSLLHHGTPPNRSDARRRALQYHYASTSCQKVSPEEHARLFS